MPTTTSTLVAELPTNPTAVPLRASLSPSSPSSSTTTVTTLRSLYSRAARAFLHRDFSLAYSLLSSAFALIHPPSSAAPDVLTPHRKKWDILRITLETTVCASPPHSKELEALPQPLRSNLVMSPQTMIASFYTRSLALFTPAPINSQYPKQPDAAFLPAQILITLVLSSLKLGCPFVGRGILEEWLARRGRYDDVEPDGEGYEKVIEIYCLQLLPQLEQWDYAKEFLQYENELPPERRERLKSALETFHAQALSSRRPPSPVKAPPRPSPPTPRAPSPAPSRSSSSSSLSTTSTHTAVPRTPRPNPLSSSASQSTTSLSSDSTVTARPEPKKPRGAVGNGHATPHHWTISRDRDSAMTPSTLSGSQHADPSLYALIRGFLKPYLTTSNLTTFLILFVVFPLLSLAVRLRRRRLRAISSNESTVAQVKRQLNGNSVMALGGLWRELVRSVGDTIRMGGRGLV